MTAACIPASVEQIDTLELVARCREQDETAWKRLYERHFDFVYRVTRRLGTPPAEAEDVVHEVFVVVHRKLHQFTGGRLTTWLYRITANITSEHHRRRRVRSAYVKLKSQFTSPEVITPERASEASEAARSVDRVLERMSPKKREVFALFELEGWTGDEIAERVGCPVNTVWTRLHHARKEFLKIARKLGVLDEEQA